MSYETQIKKIASLRRQKRVRKKVRGIPNRPRLTVYKSLKHIYAQLVDDLSQSSILGTSSVCPVLKKEMTEKLTKTQIARKVGLQLAILAKEKGIVEVIFDRNRYIYHGRLKALAEGAREGGLKF
ncbi:MAG: 50S ribosomal protein L18 [candidate division Zixibacteria bacterium]|nr:50S ribosomal protein L18 [candidate division Zixibacteria bacterium]